MKAGKISSAGNVVPGNVGASIRFALTVCVVAVLACACALSCLAPSAAYAASGEAGKLRVLFVGNSFTYSSVVGKGAAEMFALLAEANGKAVEAQRVTYGGVSLATYALPEPGATAHYDALGAKLASGKWDYVVLQEKNKWPISYPVQVHEDFEVLTKRIHAYQPKAKVLLYMTHGFGDGTKTLVNGKNKKLGASKMQAYVQAYYQALADKQGVRAVSAGMYFNKYGKVASFRTLIRKDNKHPSLEGYTLIAAACYKEIFGEIPGESIENVTGLDASEQATMFSVLKTSGMSMSPSHVSLLKGSTKQLSYNAAGQAVKFTSMDPSIAKVSQKGKVKAKKRGMTAIVMETAAGERATCYVVVESKQLRKAKVRFTGAGMTLVAGGDRKAKNPLVSETLNRYSLKWKSSKPKVATVDALGYVAGVKAGKAKIAVRDTVSGKASSFKVTVKLPAPTGLSVAPTTAKLNGKSIAAVRVSWNKVTSAKKYRVYRAKGSSKSYKYVGTVKKASYVDKRAPKNKKLRYKVVAVKGASCYTSAKSAASPAIKLSAVVSAPASDLAAGQQPADSAASGDLTAGSAAGA